VDDPPAQPDTPSPPVPPPPDSEPPAPALPPPHADPESDAPIAVVPGPDAPTVEYRPSRVEAWLAANLRPLLVICIALMAAVVNDTLFVLSGAIHRPAAKTAPEAAVPPLADLELNGPLGYALAAIMLGGALACLGAALVWCLLPEARRWLKPKLRWLTVRPLPALRVMDLIAVFVAWLGAMRILSLDLLAGLDLKGGVGIAASLAVNAVAMSVALAVGVFLARRRARGPHGSNGIWPFWTLSAAAPRHSVWHDVALGLLCYPLLLWLINLAWWLNHYILQKMGREQDMHLLIKELLKPQSTAVLAAFFVTAVVSAPFFEELLFRGILYNVLRRYLGAYAGACAAALLFASVHFVWSQTLGLFVLALILTWLYDHTGRLIAGMTLHAVNNLFSLLIALQLQQQSGG